jgi:hypothetical protein
MAEHAAAQGLIAPDALAEVVAEREVQEGGSDLKPTVAIGGASPRAARRAIQPGELEEALDQRLGDETDQNVVVEAEDQEREPSVRQGG